MTPRPRVTHRITEIHPDTIAPDGRVIPGGWTILHVTAAELELYRQPPGARVSVMALPITEETTNA